MANKIRKGHGEAAVKIFEEIGSGLDPIASDAARAALARGRPERRALEQGGTTGPVEVFIDVLPPSPQLVVVGGVHIAFAVPSVKKFALGIGGRYGRGAVVCRTEGGHGPWGPPLMISIGGGSFGLQIGGEAADLVLLIMNPEGIDHLVKSRFTLGADASVAAGPKGRTAEVATDALMHAEILTYSRTRGLFVGISLEGAVVSQDKDANVNLYGARVTPRDLLLKPGQKVPPAGRGLVDALNRLSPRNASGW